MGIDVDLGFFVRFFFLIFFLCFIFPWFEACFAKLYETLLLPPPLKRALTKVLKLLEIESGCVWRFSRHKRHRKIYQ